MGTRGEVAIDRIAQPGCLRCDKKIIPHDAHIYIWQIEGDLKLLIHYITITIVGIM